MTHKEAKALAKELCARYGLDTYVHADPATGYNIRFCEPIETIRPKHMETTLYSVGVYVLIHGYTEWEPMGFFETSDQFKQKVAKVKAQ